MTAFGAEHLFGDTDTIAVPPPQPAVRRSKPLAWWGMMTVIATEAMVFAGLLASYGFLRASARVWPPPGIPLPELPLNAVFSALLVGSSLPMWLGERAIKRGDVAGLRLWLLVSWFMGAAFFAHSIYDYLGLHFGWTDNAYGSIYYTTTGLHLAHVLVALILGIGVQAKAWSNRYDERRHLTVEVFGLYWHFVDVVWVFVFSTLFLSEHLR
jgi:heme/copper-type cytochrome/quinol oxidase subunit 3